MDEQSPLKTPDLQPLSEVPVNPKQVPDPNNSPTLPQVPDPNSNPFPSQVPDPNNSPTPPQVPDQSNDPVKLDSATTPVTSNKHHTLMGALLVIAILIVIAFIYSLAKPK